MNNLLPAPPGFLHFFQLWPRLRYSESRRPLAAITGKEANRQDRRRRSARIPARTQPHRRRKGNRRPKNNPARPPSSRIRPPRLHHRRLHPRDRAMNKPGTANLPIGFKLLPPEAGSFTDANREIGGPRLSTTRVLHVRWPLSRIVSTGTQPRHRRKGAQRLRG